jgi:hypothetical protein
MLGACLFPIKVGFTAVRPQESKKPRQHLAVLTILVFSSQIWSDAIYCSDTVAFRLYLVIIVQPLTN